MYSLNTQQAVRDWKQWQQDKGTICLPILGATVSQPFPLRRATEADDILTGPPSLLSRRLKASSGKWWLVKT